MQMSRLRSAALLAAATFGLSACVYDDYGYGHVNVGYGSAGYYDPYYDPYYGRGSYYGWYEDYYYPGTGYYVYDRYRRPYRWNDYQRRYWENRFRYYRGERHPRWDRWDWRGHDRGGWRDRRDRGEWRDRRDREWRDRGERRDRDHWRGRRGSQDRNPFQEWVRERRDRVQQND